MRQIACALIVSCLALAGAVPARAQSVDGIALLLEHLERVLATNDEAAFAQLFAPAVPLPEIASAGESLLAPGVVRAVVRERDRGTLPAADGRQDVRVVADVFVERARSASVSTFRFDVTRLPAPAGSEGDEDGVWRLLAQQRLSRIEGLYRLAIDTRRQFSLHDFTVTAEDVRLTFASGSGFVAETENGITALVLLGDGRLHFTPAPAAERGQIRIFCGRDTLDTPVTAAFVRVNPFAADTHLTLDRLVPHAVDRGDLERAQSVFKTEVVKSFNLDLVDLSRDAWSLVPGSDDLVMELRTRRYRTLTYARSSGEAEDVSLFDRERRRNLSVYPSAAKVAARGPYYSEDERLEYDVVEYDVTASYEPERQWLEARVRLRLRVRSYAITSLSMRLHETLTVRSIVSQELGRLLALRVKGQNSILVGLPQGLGRGDVLTMTVSYGGRIPPQTPDREAVTIPPPPQAGPEVRRGAALGQADIPEVVASPRFIYSNRSWWYPQPPANEYAVARMRITVPASYDVVGSGDPAVESPLRAGTGAPGDPDRKTFVFYTGQPVRYLGWVASRMAPAGRASVALARRSAGAGTEPGAAPEGGPPGAPSSGAIYDGAELTVVANPRQSGRGKGVLETATRALTLYGTLLDDFPYPTLTLALLDSALPGGHSPAYFAVVFEPLPTTPFSWRDDPVNFDSFPQFFLAHELAHQYWGQAVGWKSYHEQWISEGFAQYFAALYAERARGPDVFRDLLRQMRRSAMSRADQGPVHLGYRLGHIQGDSRVFRSIVYNKGAMVLHMLRRLVGDDAFFKALRAFYWDSRFRKVGTDDLAAVFERVTGRDLGRFFEQWILQTGTPELRFSYAVSAPARTPMTATAGDGDGQENGAPSATLVFEQRGEPFELPVTVTVSYANGQQEDVVVAVTGPRTERRIRLRGPVRSIDPNTDFGALAEIETVGRR